MTRPASPARPRCALVVVALAAILLAAEVAHAQVQIEISINRRLFILHEPILATVSIRNLSGSDLELRDSPTQPWFGFEITERSGAIVSPANPNYRLGPLLIPNGQTVKRSVNIRELYLLREYGIYNVRAFVFLADADRMFASRPTQIDLTEGKTIYRQTVGVPPGSGHRGNTRTLSLLSHSLPRGARLYARIEDPDSGTVYCTHSLGRLLSFDKPRVSFDAENQIHILQAVAPKSFVYTRLDLDGAVLVRETYHAVPDNPRFLRSADGSVRVTGGVLDQPIPADAPPEAAPPKISDRPAGLPAP